MLRSLKTTASCLALALAVSNTALAADQPSASSAPSSVQPSSGPATSGNPQSSAANAKITAEAMVAINETRNALKALDEGKSEDALAALEKTTGKLELILTRDPQLVLAPTSVEEVTTSIIADTDNARQLRKEAQRLLDDGQVQAARHLLQGLASETDIEVTNIPLGTYPDAIKHAAKLIDDGKQDEAKVVLQTALNTLVVTDTIIPLPVAATQDMLKDAEQLAEKKDRTADENKKLDDLLTAARGELRFAEVLGYGTRQNFKDLYSQLDDIKAKTSNGKSGTGFFGHITNSLSTLLRSNQPAAPNQSGSTAQTSHSSNATAQ
jgi:hypothetical protein